MPEAVRGPPMVTSASQPTAPVPVPSRPLRPAPPPAADWGQHSQPSAAHQPAVVLQQQQPHNQHAQQQVVTSADTRHVAATLPRLDGNPAANPFTASSPQHMSLPPSGGAAVTNGGDPAEPDPADAGNRNSMGFQITSITQSRASAEPDAYTIDESGDEDVSDTAESRGVAGGEAGAGAGAVPPAETVDGVPGRLVLPLAGSPPPPPAGGLSPRELTASPGVTGAEVLPVIPTIDGFGITLVPGALETVDSHARGTAEIVQFPSEIEMDLMPTGLTVGVAPGGSPGDGDLQETWQSRFKVVKIETNVPFKRGRWQCMDYMDQPESVQSPAAVRDGSVSGTSSAHSSVQLTAGEHLPAEVSHPAASEEAALPGLAVDDVVMSTASTPRGVEVAEPPPAAAVPEPVAVAQPSLSVPYQPGVTVPPLAPGGAGGGTVGREPTVTASAPSVYPPAAVGERSASLPPPQQPQQPPVLVQASEPTSPEEARLTTADGVPVFSAATSALTLPDLLPNSSLLELVQGASAEAASDSTSLGGSGAVADKIEPIDNKIEQAMDLVKSHLLLAVREEVDVLKASITKLVEKISVLERENEVLKANATPEVLAQLDTQPSQAPSPTPTPAPPPAVLQQQQQQALPQQQQTLPQQQQQQLPPPPASGP